MNGFLKIWRWPLVLAALSVFGLLSALLGQGGIWWVLSWFALAVPVLVVLWHWPVRELFGRHWRR